MNMETNNQPLKVSLTVKWYKDNKLYKEIPVECFMSQVNGIYNAYKAKYPEDKFLIN